MPYEFISPIAIDLGAKYTGVFHAHYPSGSDPADGPRSGRLITAPDGGKQWSQQGRTAKRHQRRGYQRAKLAKRLLHVILTGVFKFDLTYPMGNNQSARQWVDSLLNNRGYTYLADEINKELLGAAKNTIVHRNWPKEFPGNEPLFNCLQRLSGDLSTAAHLHNEFPGPRDFFKRPAVRELMEEHFPEKMDAKAQLEIYTETRDALDRLIKAEQEGHRRRQEYLDNIRADIKSHPEAPSLLRGTSLTHDSLSNLIGHISNLQLRPLRRYFNDASMSKKDRWDENRMKKFFWNWIKSWRTQGPKDKANRKTLLARQNDPLLRVWQETNPKLTIPPFEDQDNRRPPHCQSLLLNPKRLDTVLPNWKVITRKFLTANPGLDEELTLREEPTQWPMTKSMPNGHSWRGEANYLARLLQRVLDRSKDRDPYRLRLLAGITGAVVSQSAQNGRAELEQHTGSQHTDDFLRFAADYYKEVRAARDGSWNPEDSETLLLRCDLHTPRKSKQREQLIGAIVGTLLPDVTPLYGFLRTDKIGRSTLIGVARRAAEAQKEYGNALKEIYRHNRLLEQGGKKPEDKDVLKLFRECEQAAEKIGQWLKQDQKAWSNYASPFSLAQIYNILETDINGFSSTCSGCSRENAWRSRVDAMGSANATRLPADSVRPFDGVLRRLLDAQAYEIAQRKAEQIAQAGTSGAVHVPILIEENRFQFAEGLAEIKKSTKKKRDVLHKLGEEQTARWLDKDDRIRQASHGVCAYTGKPLGKDGQLDHIVPQSETKKWQGTAYNSEANLIYVSTRGNTDKGNQIYNLEDLKPGYLTKQFRTKDTVVIAARIQATLQPYLEGHKSYTSFLDLDPEEQLCLRHALFDPHLRGPVIRMLSAQTKARVNGTQKWFARHIIQHLKHALAKNPNPQLAVTYSIHRINAEDVHHARNVLAAAEPVYQKTAPQPAASHVVDAALTFACGLQDPQLADVLTWPLNDDLEQQTGWLKSLVPTTIGIQALQSKPKYRKPNPAGQKLFKDGLYGERFVPLLIDKKGKLAVGFEPGNSLPISKGEEQWFDLLRPFLRFQNKPLESSFSDWQQRAHDSGRSHLYFTIDRPAAFERLHRVAKEPCDDTALQQADLLDGLSYVVQKQNLSEYLTKDKGKEFKTRDEVLDRKNFEWKPDFSGGALPREFFRPKDKPLTLPAKADWERIVNSECLKYKLGKDGAKGFNWRNELESLFPSHRTGRLHQAVRKDYSLPTIPSKSGKLVRIRRRTPEGQPVWQVVAIDGAATVGFAVNQNGTLAWDEPVPIPLFLRSPAVHERGGRHRPAAGNVCPLDDWRKVDFDKTRYGWLTHVEYAPGSQERFYIRVQMPFAEFKKRIAPFTEIKLTSPSDLPTEIKITDAKGFKEKYGELLGQPRKPGSRIVIVSAGDIVIFWYIVESTSSAMRERYEQARRSEPGI